VAFESWAATALSTPAQSMSKRDQRTRMMDRMPSTLQAGIASDNHS
jgi:hypothetical protein